MSEELKHTPGPWVPEFGESYRVRAKQDGGQVAIMMNLKGQHGLIGRRTGDEVAANARLIAAAPELLESLKAIMDFCGPSDPNCPDGPDCETCRMANAARAAIAKAEGRGK
jgi:hypothetical protein